MDILKNNWRLYKKYRSLKSRLEKYIPKQDMPYVLAAVLLGFVNHFLYQLSGGQAFAALFCPVNESVWEHLKLLFFPLFFVTIIEYIRRRPAALPFFYRRFLAVACAMAATVTLFYTYTGIIGRNFLLMDILIFIFSILSVFYTYTRFCRHAKKHLSQSMVFSLWILAAMCFFAFTCFPPDIPLFFSGLN